ncbi:MAG TPA: M15 family metallopeptidase [Actinomycetota bacterium]|nr:M15 family metallopeptidase [Actinomycetota bacterium]
MTGRRFIGYGAALVVGAAVGTLVALGVAAAFDEPDIELPVPKDVASAPVEATPSPVAAIPKKRPRVLLAWATGGLPSTAETVLEEMREVARVTTVRAGVDWLAAGGRMPGAAIPLEVAIVRPREYARFVAPAERPAVLGLERGEALLPPDDPQRRQPAAGRLRLVDRTVRVVGRIDEVATSGYEVLLAGPDPASWDRVDRFLLIQLRDPRARGRIQRTLRSLLGPGQSLRVRAKGETPFLRYGDAVLPQLSVKNTFGEFAARPLPDGRIEVDPRWIDANIRTAQVPILGKVACHRTLIPQLRAALAEVRAEGLGHTINTSQYGGCYGPRFIGLEPGGRLSHHTWGIAIDINVAENAFGTRPTQDPRLVAIMEDHGFTWGGRWLFPDGMHFEWVAFP